MIDTFLAIVLAAIFLRVLSAVVQSLWYRAKWGNQTAVAHRAFGRYLEGTVIPWWMALLERIFDR